MPTNKSQQNPVVTVADRAHERLWTIAVLADYLGVTEQTIYEWRTRGYGPKAVRVGKHLRWRAAVVEKWIESVEETDSAAGTAA